MSVEVKTVKCDLCGKQDEGLELSKRFLFFKVKFRVCETCVSRLFRRFRKER